MWWMSSEKGAWPSWPGGRGSGQGAWPSWPEGRGTSQKPELPAVGDDRRSSSPEPEASYPRERRTSVWPRGRGKRREAWPNLTGGWSQKGAWPMRWTGWSALWLLLLCLPASSEVIRYDGDVNIGEFLKGTVSSD